MRGRGNEISMRHRIRVNARRDQARVMRHVHHEIRPYFFRNFGHACPIKTQGIGRGAAYQQLRLALHSDALHLVVIDFFFIV